MPFTSDMIIDSIKNATPPLSTERINRVPGAVTEIHDYQKYYVPKVVSIGPYHFGTPKLEYVEKLKPFFTMKVVSNEETLRSLYEKLGEPGMVRELRSFYEENSTTTFCDEVFTKMMLLDCCFILYYIQFIYGVNPYEDCAVLKSHQIAYIHHDLFLLENQIPFRVINVAMELIKLDLSYKITPFINDNILVSHVKPRRKWMDAILCLQTRRTIREEQKMELIGDNEPNHLLHLLHRTLTKHENIPKKDPPVIRCTFRNVNELEAVGVSFKRSDTMSLAYVKFLPFWLIAEVELPPITVDEFTKPTLLNLIAYEMSSDVEIAWITSYACLLDSLIGHPEDVEILRNARVIEDSFGRDEEVVKLFNEIATGLVPDPSAYWKAKYKLQRYHDIRNYSPFSQMQRQYQKNPALFFSSFGIPALFLSVVQTYFTIWSPKGTCDDLCMFLKKNHHL